MFIWNPFLLRQMERLCFLSFKHNAVITISVIEKIIALSMEIAAM